MSKEASYKHKVDKLTFYAGRLYAPGETIEFVGDEARYAAAHYGQQVSEPETQSSKVAQAVKSQKATVGAE